MAKAKRKSTRKSDGNQVELRRWCIEQAVRWPTKTVGGYAGLGGAAQGQMGQLGYTQPHQQDEDIIGRANKLLAWVTT